MASSYPELTAGLKDAWGERNASIDAAARLYNLKDVNFKPGYQSTVTNDPRVFVDRAIHFLSAENPKPRIVVANEPPVQRGVFSSAERGLVGIWRVLDERYFNSGRGGLAVDSARRACMTGYLFRLTGVVKDDKGQPLFLAENWETKDCYPAYGENELRRFLHEYEVSVEVAEEKAEVHDWAMPDLDRRAETVKISDYYEKKKGQVLHRIWVADQLVQEISHEEFENIPIRGGLINAGHTILDANVENYRASNKLMSDLLEGVHRAVKGMLVVTTDRQQFLVTQEDFAKGEGIIPHILPGETIQSIQLSRVPPEAAAILNILGGERQRGGFSYAVYGGVLGEMPSGYALAQLIAGALAVAGPYKVGLDSVDSRTFRDWLKQFKEGGFKPIKVSGNMTGKLDGLFHEEFSRDSIADFQYVHVDRPMAFTDTRMENLLMARQAAPQIPQLLSLHTVLDEFLHVDDPEAEARRIDEDRADMSEPKQRLDMALAYERLADEEARRGHEREARLLRAMSASLLEAPESRKGVVAPAVPPEYGTLATSREDMLRSILSQAQPRRTLARQAAGQGIELGGREML